MFLNLILDVFFFLYNVTHKIIYNNNDNNNNNSNNSNSNIVL